MNSPRTLRPVMEPAEMLKTIEEIKPGSEVEIQFKESEVFDVAYLMGMHGKILEVDNNDVGAMIAIAQTHLWDNPTNRIFRFTAGDSFSLSWFAGRLQRRLESIVILK